MVALSVYWLLVNVSILVHCVYFKHFHKKMAHIAAADMFVMTGSLK